jgi:hypothetical protein
MTIKKSWQGGNKLVFFFSFLKYITFMTSILLSRLRVRDKKNSDTITELKGELAAAKDRLSSMPKHQTSVDVKGPMYQFEVVTRERIAALQVQIHEAEKRSAEVVIKVRDMALQVSWDEARVAEEHAEVKKMKSR